MLAASGLMWMLDAGPIWLPLGAGVLATGIGPVALHFSGRKDRVWAKDIDETSVALMGLHPAVIAELEAQ